MIKTWEERAAESTEEFNDMPLGKWHFMQLEINDLRAEMERFEKAKRLIAELDSYRFCMSYNVSYYGEPAGSLKQLTRNLNDLAFPPK